MKNIENVLFDLDGTLTDPYEGITASVKYALAKMNREVPNETTLGDFIGPPLPYSFMRHCGMTEEQAERALLLYREYYEKSGVFALNVYDGVTDMLDALKTAEKKVFIATSKPEKYAEQIADKFGLVRYLDGIAGASADLTRIEKADVIAYAAERFGIDNGYAVMVGDRSYDVIGAAKCGMPCIGVTYGYGSADEFSSAAFIAKSPHEVAEIILRDVH